jgi:hypothetical protein
MILPNIWKNKSHVPNHQPDGFTLEVYPTHMGNEDMSVMGTTYKPTLMGRWLMINYSWLFIWAGHTGDI